MDEKMNTYQLSFARVDILREDIAEIFINDGIEVDVSHVDEAEEFLATHLTTPYSVLFNKKNQYSLSFEAQLKMGNQEPLNAVAILCYTEHSRKLTTTQANNIPMKSDRDAKIFTNRTEAISWLESEQDKNKGSGSI